MDMRHSFSRFQFGMNDNKCSNCAVFMAFLIEYNHCSKLIELIKVNFWRLID